nr:reverse transcriptase domain-containing protein [Tanacetum cinerariifolium]
NGTEGPLVIEAEMGRHAIHRMYIAGGSSMKILYEHCFNRLRPEIKSQMVPATTSLTGFSGETIWPLGQLRLLVTTGDATHYTKTWMNFMVVKSMSPYNGIIGRPGLKAIQAVPSTVYGMLKFPVEGGIATIRNTILIPTECASVITSSVTPRDERTRPANFTVALHPDFPDQEVVIGGSLSDKGRTELCSVLKKNLDIFAWQPSDMTGVPRSVAEHRLNIREGYTPVRKKKRGQAPERARAIQAEVHKLVDARIMGEVYYQDWLSNPVMVMTRPDVAGRLQKWSIVLGEHNITYRPRMSVKGKILADFLIEMPGDVPQAAPAAVAQEEPWTLFTDGSSCIDGSGAGLILTNPEGVNVDSKLVANQVLGTYVAKEDNMIKYLEIVRGLVSGFTTFSISQVPQSKNKQADALSKIASTSFTHLSKQVLVEVLENKFIKEKEVAVVIEKDGPTWMTQIADYLKEGVLPRDNKEARKLRLKARQYELIEGVLYRRSFLTPWLRCVGPLQADYVMREIHKGSCSMHAGPRSVVAKAIRLGYYWPTMHKDARDMIRKCNDCQIYRPVTRHPQQSLTPITAPWSFYKWGIDIAGPFLEGPGKVKFLIVAMDYFTKKGEPKPGEGIKARLGEGNNNWVEEIPHVLWAHRTMIKSSHGDTPFSLTYGTEAVIHAEIRMPTYRTATERAAVCEARAKSKMMKYYNARVRGVAFKPGDFVYRSNDASHAVAGGKLGPKWEGLYEVTEALGNGAYKPRSTDGTVLPKTWNVTILKRCYL